MRIILKSKIHRATVTDCNVDYSSSITIPKELMIAANIIEFEQVHVLDVNNGNRLITYAIAGDNGQVCINGAAARKVEIGDQIIILCYEIRDPIVQINETYKGTTRVTNLEPLMPEPKIIKVDGGNKPI